ncbi:hypothetical protein ACMV8I_19580 [Ewingella sp. S1.OA.A_B6]
MSVMRIKTNRKIVILLSLTFVIAIAGVIYSLWKKYAIENFSCAASFSQHYSNESLDVSLNYIFRENVGIININGHATSDPTKVFNRKISFSLQKKQDIYYLISDNNLKFPDDTVEDSWLSQYEPDFFVYANKSIHMRIVQQANGSRIFFIATVPTYVCKS